MKFTIIMKNPDSFEDSIRRAAEESVEELNLDIAEKREMEDEKYQELKKIASKWIEDDEYLRVEIDTEANTATVLEV